MTELPGTPGWHRLTGPGTWEHVDDTDAEAEIAALKTSNPALDLTGLDKAVADLTALAAPPAA
jgi:hypothetical protein